MPELILIIGPSGAGKTTYARMHYPQHLHPDYEALIRTLFASQDLFRFYPQVRATGARLHRLAVRELLLRQMNVCIPETAGTALKRKQWIDIAQEANVLVHCILLRVDQATAIHRACTDSLRPKTARPSWPPMIERWYRDFEPVCCEEEGITDYREVDWNHEI